MKSNLEMLQMISSGDYSNLMSGISLESANIIREKINEIPESFTVFLFISQLVTE